MVGNDLSPTPVQFPKKPDVSKRAKHPGRHVCLHPRRPRLLYHSPTYGLLQKRENILDGEDEPPLSACRPERKSCEVVENGVRTSRVNKKHFREEPPGKLVVSELLQMPGWCIRGEQE